MERFHEVLLDVWREACRHIEITESTATIAQQVAQHLPLNCLLVRRFDIQQQAIETVATGLARPGPLHATGRTPSTAARWKRLLNWADTGKLLRVPARRRTGEAVLLIPPEVDGEALVGPLLGPHGPAGALIMVAEHPHAFRKVHEQLLLALLEPFSAALENDRRLHELAALRAAAEADRNSLLTRLGRQEVSETIVGAESGLRQVMERVQLVAGSDIPVLILGETGTGKEVVSRAIHTRSPRASGPFIRVNCGAIPAELIDSQLFGHERGSFTGASDARQGWFERADRGTLFLDEIGELPLPAQVRLLRVLQDGLVERVGGQHSIRVDVRVVAATHRDLASMVKSKTFREDLWYRINVFPILLPRLRERVEDIPALSRHFAQRAAHRFGLAYIEPSPADLHLLTNYPWPGNIRELGAVIDRAAILGEGQRLDVGTALGFNHSLAAAPSVSDAPTLYEVIPESSRPLQPSPAQPDEILSLATAMKQHIERALVATRGRIEGSSGAAALLKINPHTLRARRRKLGVQWDTFRAP